ncbi:MAG: hypothetical protein M5U28_12120 [Sandaracinaceae bacterium]|nr:hypothetical protein [Sandaracinaceae bacterium]
MPVAVADPGRKSTAGSQLRPSNISSKCTCGPRLMPVEPTSPMMPPRGTRCPATTEFAELCAYMVTQPPGCTSITMLP